MKPVKKIHKILLWIARIWGGIVILFVGSLLGAHILQLDETSKPLSDPIEILVFLCFPILTLLGLLIAYKLEGLGGLISIFALTILGYLRFDLLDDWPFILGIYTPGIIYAVYWILTSNVFGKLE